jgi:hypothetical protein
VGENHKDFGAIGWRNVSSAAANGDFALAGGSPVTQGFHKLRVESFHRMPASSLFDSELLYRRGRGTDARRSLAVQFQQYRKGTG